MCWFQIKAIREESEKLKKKIHDYQRELTNQIEAYNSELMAKKEQLEEPRAKVRKLMREGHVTEQIQQKDKMTKELVKNTEVDLKCELIRRPVLIARGTEI